MDRPICYPGQVPADSDFLTVAKAAMLGFHGVLRAAFGTSTYYDGLAVTAGTGLNVTIGPGSIVVTATTDATAYGSLGTDSTSIVKQGINTASSSLGPFTAPTTSGQSVNILIQAEFAEVDSNSALLLYYNANNPSTPFGGSNNNGVSQPTLRKQIVALSYVVGTAATTGTQTTPTLTTGWTPIAVVTIAYGDTSITTISQTTSNKLLSKLGNVLQSTGSLTDASAALVTSGWAQAVLAVETARAEAAEATKALLAGSATQAFNVANAASATGAVAFGQFTASLGASGYKIEPNSSSPTGKIITQWGYGTNTSSGVAQAVVFPTTFPTAVLH
ncbi:MAG: hypothetical protein P4L71_20140, partial [Acetobacteraceae bacterium]|nr:hypothetical protein [Acetobacteraceae bacterium]